MFGENIIYLYGNVFKNRFITPFGTYNIQENDLQILNHFSEDVDEIKLFGLVINGTLSLFNINAKIINTYIIDTNTNEAFSWDVKKNFIKENNTESNIKSGKFYLCKIIHETDEIRELVRVKHLKKIQIPGVYCKGTLKYINNKSFVTTEIGVGEVILQKNEGYSTNQELDTVLIKLENNILTFAEINNPVRHATVNIVKTNKETHWVKNNNISGILLPIKNVQNKTDIFVKVHKIRLGSYVFVESAIVLDTFQFFKLVSHVKNDIISQNLYIIYLIKTKEKIKAILKNFPHKKVFGGKIVDYNENTHFYTIECQTITSKDTDNNVKDNNEDIINEIQKETQNPLPLFIKYETYLYNDINILVMYLNYLNDNNMFELENVKKYLTRLIKFESNIQKLCQIDNKELLLFLFNKTCKKNVFLHLIKWLSVEELEVYCRQKHLLKFYLGKLTNENRIMDILNLKLEITPEIKQMILKQIKNDDERTAIITQLNNIIQ